MKKTYDCSAEEHVTPILRKKRKPYAILIRQCIFEFNSPLLVLLDGRAESQVFWNVVDGIVKISLYLKKKILVNKITL